jgi:hypothetical protein
MTLTINRLKQSNVELEALIKLLKGITSKLTRYVFFLGRFWLCPSYSHGLLLVASVTVWLKSKLLWPLFSLPPTPRCWS